MVYRINKLSQTGLIAWICAPLSIVRSAFVVTLGVLTLEGSRNFPRFVTHHRQILIISMGMGAFTDVLLSGCMVYLLWGKQKGSNFSTYVLVERMLCVV